MKYLFDNCISYRFAKMLAAVEVDVVALRDVYPEDIKDVELFAKLKGLGYVFVTTDESKKPGYTRRAESRKQD